MLRLEAEASRRPLSIVPGQNKLARGGTGRALLVALHVALKHAASQFFGRGVPDHLLLYASYVIDLSVLFVTADLQGSELH